VRLAIIVNPIAGRGRAWKKLQRHLKAWPHPECQFETHLTRCPGHAGVIAQELLENPPDLLAVCGGDGTLNEVASQVPSPPFPVAILPSGTANVLARELGLPLDAVRALEVALDGPVRRVDLGFLNTRVSRHFLLMAGIGLDAYVVLKCNARAKRYLGIAAYYEAVIRCLLTYPFYEFQVTTENDSIAASSCVIANSSRYGGGLVLVPEASISDGVLNVLALQETPKLNYFRFLLAAWRGKALNFPWVRRFQARSIRIEGPRGIWAHTDGELVGTLPLEAGIAAKGFPLKVAK
jgi:YegS/Rv2252/BmrU family lipid kinase